MRLWEQAPEILILLFSKENYKLYIRGYSPFCSYLTTKESYDRWVTRRVWGFRHQISKTKYLKMSVGNIRKLQENTVALYTERKTLRVSVIRGSGYVWPEKLKRPPLPSGCVISGCEMSTNGIPDVSDRVSWNVLLSHPLVRHPDVKCRRTEFLPGWNKLCCARGTVCVCKV